MAKKVDIAALGELLIDFTESGVSADGRKLFEQNPGGAPANLLTVASHMGYRTAFIGKVGKDMHGEFLKRTLQEEGIDTSGLIEDPDCFTTLAFVEIDEKGERRFSFARKPGADTQLRKEELNRELLINCKIFHFGSLSLTQEPSKSTVLEAIRIAKEAGALISFDPNYRAPLWKKPNEAVNAIKEVLPLVDILKVSDEESILLTKEEDYGQAAQRLLSMGLKFVAITLGSRGALASTAQRKEVIRACAVKAVDTTGAGDSFWGGFLSCFLSLGLPLEDMSWEQIRRCVEMGNTVAGLCVQKRGGIPAIPTKEMVMERMNQGE